MAGAVANMFMVLYYQAETEPRPRGTTSVWPWTRCGNPCTSRSLAAGKKNKKNILLLTDRLTYWEGQGRLLGRLCLFRSYIVKGEVRVGMLEHRHVG